MDFDFEDQDLRRICEDATNDGGLGVGVARALRKAIWSIGAANDERDLRVPNGNRFEKLKGRDGEFSIRLNKQWRLIFRLEMREEKKTVVILRVGDYH